MTQSLKVWDNCNLQCRSHCFCQFSLSVYLWCWTIELDDSWGQQICLFCGTHHTWRCKSLHVCTVQNILAYAFKLDTHNLPRSSPFWLVFQHDIVAWWCVMSSGQATQHLHLSQVKIMALTSQSHLCCFAPEQSCASLHFSYGVQSTGPRIRWVSQK